MTTIALVGTLDTKGREYARLAELIRDLGAELLVIDVGINGEPVGSLSPDLDATTVARAASADLDALRAGGDRGAAIAAMGAGVAAIVAQLYGDGRLDAVLAIGGSGGTTIATAAMRALPFGVPKLMVSTLAGGDVSAYVRGADIVMVYPVVDPVGDNAILDTVLRSAAGAIVGMACAVAARERMSSRQPVVSATMFGVTTPGVTAARTHLEKVGYEVLTFHATGVGGDGMERLIASGLVDGVLDLTTTELADELVGGIHPAGPERLRTAGRLGIPQVISPGALDMVNFGPSSTVPAQFAGRTFVSHNPNVTLMRTTPQECQVLGRRLAERARASRGPVNVLLPLRGVSALSVPGGAFYDAAADQALFDAVRKGCGDMVPLIEIDCDINHPDFGIEAAKALISIQATTDK